MGRCSCVRQTPRNPVCLPPSIPRGQGQPLSSLISSYCNSAQHLSPPTSDPRLAAVSHLHPVQIAQLRHGPFLPEEERRPPQAPQHLKRNQPESHTQQASKGVSDWSQQRSTYPAADKVLATYLLLLKRDKRKALTWAFNLMGG